MTKYKPFENILQNTRIEVSNFSETLYNTAEKIILDVIASNMVADKKWHIFNKDIFVDEEEEKKLDEKKIEDVRRTWML